MPSDDLSAAENNLDVHASAGARGDRAPTARLYLQWLHESSLSHSGFPTSVIYLRDTAGDPFPTLTEEAMVTVDSFGAEMTAADAMTLALESFGAICEEDPFAEAVARFGDLKRALVADYAKALEQLAEVEQQGDPK